MDIASESADGTGMEAAMVEDDAVDGNGGADVATASGVEMGLKEQALQLADPPAMVLFDGVERELERDGVSEPLIEGQEAEERVWIGIEGGEGGTVGADHILSVL